MDEDNAYPQVTQTTGQSQQVRNIAPTPQQGRTVHDWIRDMRMSPDVNKTTVGVETDQVTPELMLATSRKLLGISRREQEPDPKDSLQFQRVYGPTDYFAEHIMRDSGKLGRNLLWKATNKGNLDFMPTAALDKHISDVFYDSKLANMVDGSSPLELMDASMKITRIGEGGVGDQDSAPTEMRLVQPSFMGFVDPARSVDSFRVGLDAYLAKHVKKGSDGKLYREMVNAHTGKKELVDSVTAARSVVTTPEMMRANTSHIYALGGKTGVRIVPKEQVDYYLPNTDEIFSTSANLVPMASGVKEMRLHMGCLHPATTLLYTDREGMTYMAPAREVKGGNITVPSITDKAKSISHIVRATIAKFPKNRSWFVKIVLLSGRTLITSKDHRWSIADDDNNIKLIEAQKLKPGMHVLRTTFQDVPCRRTYINGICVGPQIARMLGYAVLSLQSTDQGGVKFSYDPEHEQDVRTALEKLGADSPRYYTNNGSRYVSMRDGMLAQWLKDSVHIVSDERAVPPEILSASPVMISEFLDGYTHDKTKVGIDDNEDYWLFGIANAALRDQLAFLWMRLDTDTCYRDAISEGKVNLALQLIECDGFIGDCVLDSIKAIKPVPSYTIMVDVDVNDNLFATANGIITHNSKYALQAVPLDEREPQLVRTLDQATGKDMSSVIGKYLGAQYAHKDGTVSAVRKDRIDVIYSDGTKGSVPLYRDYPMNAKGYIDNEPQVKAGQSFKAGDLLASSNYTDKKGVAAVGRPLRTAWLSWKGGTYEDAVVLSEDAAKKLTSTTMYPTAIDLDNTISLGKKNYQLWKPGEYNKDQMATLDDDGVVKPGTVLHKGDPVVLAIQTTEPSPGTLGKRLFTDMSEIWEHDKPGVVRDVVKTRKGVKVLTTVTAPVEVGDKLSGCFDDRTEVFTDRGFVKFAELMENDKVAVLHPDGTATFELPKAYQSDYYEGCMIEHITRRTSMKVTPNHNVAFVPRYAYENGDTSLIKRTAAEIYGNRIFMRVSANFDSTLGNPVDEYVCLPPYTAKARIDQDKPIRRVSRFLREDFAAFIGIYLAEGHSGHKPGHRWIRISQYDNVEGGAERCAKIAALLTRMGVEWHYYDHQYFMISNWPLHAYVSKLGNSYGKYIPEEVFKDWAKSDINILLEWFYMGDGEKSICEGGALRCATVSERLANDLQRLYILTGRYSTIHNTATPNTKSGTIYKITSSYKEFICFGQNKHNWKIDDSYAGMIYCVTTSTGIILTRRDGIIMWNGQSFGNKGTVAQILPVDQMPQDKDGNPMDMLFSPLSLISRTNASMLHEALLGKVAHKTGKPEIMPVFNDNDISDYVNNRLKQTRLKAEDDLVNPETGRTIPSVLNGYSYIYKLKHLSESKMAGRGTGTYSQDDTPTLGSDDGAKRYGTLESSAMAGHMAFKNLLDAKLIRGQANTDFWRSLRMGQIPVMPGEPMIHRKFFAHLQGAGVNVRRTPKGVSVFSLTNGDVNELAGSRELKSRDTYEAKTFRPIDGGLFGQDVFGPNGDKWAYIQLDEPLPNPVMEEPLARLLNISDKDFQAIVAGQKEVNGMKSPADMKARLAKMDLAKESADALREFKGASKSRKDAALKRYKAIELMRRAGENPAEYMLDRIPVLPPEFRPVTSANGLTMVADSNYLYAQMLDARNDMRDAKDLPAEYQNDARANIYRKWKELTGLYDPESPKLQAKNVKGLLAWAVGGSGTSPKFSAVQRKLIGMSVDTVGRGVVIPDPRVKLNEVGMPAEMAFKVFAPFVERSLVQAGYTPMDAMKLTKAHDPKALDILRKVMETHPVQMNRAPTLHKLSIMGFKPVLTSGHAIHVNPSIVVPFGMDFDGNCIDYNSEIYLKISKSRLDKGTKVWYNISVAKQRLDITNNGEKKMLDPTQETTLFNIEDDNKDAQYCRMKIGEFPRRGLARQDRNGASVYDVTDGIEVLGCDPVTGKAAWYPVSHVTEEKNVHTVKVKAGNREVIVSDNESLAVFDNATGRLVKVAPSKDEARLIPILKKDIRPYGDYGDRDLGWLFGAFISNGWKTDHTIGYTKMEEVKRNEFVRIMRNYHDNFTVYTYNGYKGEGKLGDSVKIHLNSKSLIEWWDQWDFMEDSSTQCDTQQRAALRKKIDGRMIQQGSGEFLWGLLSGLLDGDGSIVKNTSTGKSRFTCRLATSSKKLKETVCELLWRLGIRYSVTEIPPRNFSNTAYVIMPSTVDMWDNLDRLTCIGERETALIQEWRQSAPAGDKKDQIPVTVDEAKALAPYISPKVHSSLYNALHRSGDKKKSLRCARYALLDDSEFIKEHAPSLYDRASNMDVIWCEIESIEDAGMRDVYDLEVVDAKVYAANNGFIVWDTANLHVPVSDQARKETIERMFPERNLIAMRNRQIAYKPEKEYIQGLYVATRMKNSSDGRTRIFDSLDDARQAQRDGIIDVDDPIIIRGK